MYTTGNSQPAKTIDQVIEQLEGLIESCIANKDRLGYFAALYHKVTVRVKEGITNKEFEDGARMDSALPMPAMAPGVLPRTFHSYHLKAYGYFFINTYRFVTKLAINPLLMGLA